MLTSPTTLKTSKKIAKPKEATSNDPPLVININYTQYELIHEVAEELGMRTSIDDDEDWDIWFIDGPTMPTLLSKMNAY